MTWLFLSMLLLQNIDSKILEQKSLEAREILKKEFVSFRKSGKSAKSRIVSRDILLAVDYKNRSEIKLVRLEVDVLSGRKFKFKVVTPGYRVERIAGLGITRLQFNVRGNDGEKLVVLDSRHLHLENQRTSPRDLFYFPYSDDFLREEITAVGSDFLSSAIKEVQKETCEKQIVSRAFPGKLMCDVYGDIEKYLYALGASEQIDDGEFYASSEYSFSKFLVHVGRNKEQAFYYSVSVDGARGLMQFMNKKGNMTYKWVKDSYPEAELISDFEKGTADFKNSLMSAWLLFDLNLSKLSNEAQSLILINPKLGGFLGAAAHNAGWKRGAKRLFAEIVAGKITVETKNFQKSRIPKETKGFLKKFSFVWDRMQGQR